MTRSNLSIAIVDMSKVTISFISFSFSLSYPPSQRYGWPSSEKGVYLSAFFWGYIGSQLIGGFLARKLGAKVVHMFAITVPCILTVITPFVALRRELFVAIRVLIGFTEGVCIGKKAMEILSYLCAFFSPPFLHCITC